MSSWYGPYITVAQKKARAKKVVQNLRMAGLTVNPVEAFNGSLATTFWGKSWNDNLETYADCAYRLQRGRSYVRHGCICHLEIHKGKVKAKVNGTSLYDVEISIKTLAQERWRSVCEKCAGHIGSIMELLQGKFSKNVMQIVTDPKSGIFPELEEIRFKCSCPDSAYLCKHVGSVLYAIGRRLDTEPELLFTLRGVDACDLIPATMDVTGGADTDLDSGDMGALFGIDLDVSGDDLPLSSRPQQSLQMDATKKAETESCGQAATLEIAPGIFLSEKPLLSTKPRGLFSKERPTGASIAKLRNFADLSENDFARALNVGVQTLKRWENTSGLLRLQPKSVDALLAVEERIVKARVREK